MKKDSLTMKYTSSDAEARLAALRKMPRKTPADFSRIRSKMIEMILACRQ